MAEPTMADMEWPPPTISKWVRSGTVSVPALLAELRGWTAFLAEESVVPAHNPSSEAPDTETPAKGRAKT